MRAGTVWGQYRKFAALLFPFLLAAQGCHNWDCRGTGGTLHPTCGCKPGEAELYSRISLTELPYPVRSSINRCVNQIHSSQPPGEVTQQSLGDCIQRDTLLDPPTRNDVVELINKSTLADQKDVNNWNACVAVASAQPVPAGQPGAMPPGGVPAGAPGAPEQPGAAGAPGAPAYPGAAGAPPASGQPR